MDDPRDRRPGMDARPLRDRGARESAHVRKRLQRARAPVDRRPARRPLAGAREDRLRRGSRVRGLDPAALSRGTIDAVLRDQCEDAIGRAAGQPDQCFAAVAGAGAAVALQSDWRWSLSEAFAADVARSMSAFRRIYTSRRGWIEP